MQVDTLLSLGPQALALFPVFGAEISALCRIKCQVIGRRFGTIPNRNLNFGRNSLWIKSVMACRLNNRNLLVSTA